MNERSGFIQRVLGILSGAVLFVFVTLFVTSLIFNKNIDRLICLGIILFITISILLIKNTKAGKKIMPSVEETKRRNKNQAAATKAAELERAIYQNNYYQKPVSLNDEQRHMLDVAFLDACRKLEEMGAYSVGLLDMTDEELYTLWFIHKTTAPLHIKPSDDFDFIADIGLNGTSAIIPKKTEKILKPYKKASQVKIRTERKKHRDAIRKQRRAHRIALARKKEEKAKRAARRPGKRRQAPNYEFYSKEWISQNIGYVTKLIANASAYDEKYANALIPIDKLPPDVVTQQLIAKKLKDDKVICRYTVDNTGISIRARTKYKH